MATHTIKSDSSKQWVINKDNDTWNLAENATLHVYGKTAVYVAAGYERNTLNINGDILNTGGETPSGPDFEAASLGIYVVGNNNTINIGATSHIMAGAGVVALQSNGATVNNRGDIVATNVGIVLGGAGVVVNSGEITGFQGVSAGADSTVTNTASGRIIGGAGAVEFSEDGDNKLFNQGFIAAAGGPVAIADGNGNSRIINTGTIEGAVSLGGGSDRFDTSMGVFRGTVTGGDGDDTYLTSSKLSVIEAVGEGTDTVRSSASFTLAANVEALVLTGKAINGTGNELDNTITGNAGNNKLDGKAGADVLDGGKGNDILIGGTEGDLFLFRPGYGVDTIKDYADGTDKIGILGFAKIDDFSELTIKQNARTDGDVWIELGNGDRIVIEDTLKTDLDATDFLFSLVV
ncbi:hypothetical protein JJB09_03150 [Rhizobium sp. KVB221]|uniref:Calcium-binding protein n=1 Tax=Rhizobium setariae TaxID=2801340 RepID=A0A937CJE3_9HYPH|nr:calcium-binding protein [Rhizobium setariae]MBL0371015.1 hypothetical protein [Rhizobium setariae]